MKTMRIFILLFSLSAWCAANAANGWHDDVISTMNTAKDVERSIAVNRNPNTKEIKTAVYRYTFKGKKLYNVVRNWLIQHEPQAVSTDIYSGKYGDVKMKFREGKGYRNYRLSTSQGKHTLIVSVNTGDTQGSTVMDDETRRRVAEQTAEAHRQAAELQRIAREQAKEARRQAEEARRKAQLEAAEVRRKAQLEAAEARRQSQREAAEARRQATEARRQAQLEAAEARRQAQLEAAEARRQAQIEAANARREATEMRRLAAQERKQSTVIRQSRSGSSRGNVIIQNNAPDNAALGAHRARMSKARERLDSKIKSVDL